MTPNCYKLIVIKRNNYGAFPALVVFLAVFFRKFDKQSQNVTIRGVTIRGHR